jgi:large subunit ribosomal protein L21
VTATVMGERKGPKLDTMIFRRRKNSRKNIGHRQHYLRVKIDEIVA